MVAGPNLTVLYKWTPLNIDFHDSFNVPTIPNTNLSKVTGDSDTFMFTFTNKTNYIQIIYTQ